MKGQNMIGTLARKRTNLAAFAVLAALAVALFAATISSQASPSINSSTDTDFIIGDGEAITVGIANGTVGDWTFQPIFGFVLSNPDDSLYDGGEAKYTHQAGAPEGDFTVRATHASLPPLTKTLTVGDAGTNLATANVNLGTTFTTADGATTTRATAAQITAGTGINSETATSNAGTNIYIEVEALNSHGNASNVGTTATTQLSVTVFAVDGVVADATGGDDATTGTPGGSDSDTDTADNKVGFAVSRSGAGTVEVFAVATIGSTSVRSESLTLTFTVVAGAPAVVSIDGDATAAQGGASLTTDDNDSPIAPAVAATRGILPVSATDDKGNTATLLGDTAIMATVKNASDTAVTDNEITDVAVARYVLDTDGAKTGNQSGIVVTLPADAAPGDYTVEATLGTSKSQGTLTVTGPATSVDVSIDAPDGTGLGAQLTVTATVTDKNGNNVAPTAVKFDSDTSPVTLVGSDSNTKDGVATRTAVVTGTGVITIVASVGDGATAVTGVAVIVAGAADDDAADGPSLGDLSRHSGVASYTGPDATASDLLALLAGRATIIWLSDGENWTAYYALIDGSEAPGSSNFTVTSGDVLYIGN